GLDHRARRGPRRYSAPRHRATLADPSLRNAPLRLSSCLRARSQLHTCVRLRAAFQHAALRSLVLVVTMHSKSSGPAPSSPPNRLCAGGNESQLADQWNPRRVTIYDERYYSSQFVIDLAHGELLESGIDSAHRSRWLRVAGITNAQAWRWEQRLFVLAESVTIL